MAAAALVARALFLIGGARGELGSFADALDLTVGLGLTLCALSLTGGIRSELYVLLLVDLVLARSFFGPGASRFLAVATLLGLGLLAAAGPWGADITFPLAVGLRCLWPLALLLGMEAWDTAATTRREVPVQTPAPPQRTREDAELPRGHLTELFHDLRSPLTVIRLYVEALSERASRGLPPLHEQIVNLQAELDMMQALLGSERPSAEPGRRPGPSFDLVPLLDGLTKTYRLAHEGRLRIEFSAESPDVPVAADPLAVRRAVRNVLDNAVKYTAPGGEVRVRVARQGREARVEVSDTGAGMSAEEQSHAFDASYRSEASRASGANGWGLGLGLSRQLLQANGGRISLVSAPGRGSEVTILLPAATEVQP